MNVVNHESSVLEDLHCRRQSELTSQLDKQGQQHKQAEQQLRESLQAREADLHSSVVSLKQQLAGKSATDTAADKQLASLRAEADSSAAALQVCHSCEHPAWRS